MSNPLYGQDVPVAARCHDIAQGLNGWGVDLFAEIVRCGNAARIALAVAGPGKMDRNGYREWASQSLSFSEDELQEATAFLVEAGAATLREAEISFHDDTPRSSFAKIGKLLKEMELGEFERATLLITEELSRGRTTAAALHKHGDPNFIDETIAIGISSGFIRRTREGRVVHFSLKCPTASLASLRAPTLLVG